MSDINLVYSEIMDSVNSKIAASELLICAAVEPSVTVSSEPSVSMNISGDVTSSAPVMPPINLSVTVPIDDSIKAAAMARFQAEEEAKRLASIAALKKEQDKVAEIGSYIQEEQLKARILEEQIRRMAEKAVIEAEARALALAKEKAVEAEMERLRKRTKTEVLEDTVAELSNQLASFKAKQNDTYRC